MAFDKELIMTGKDIIWELHFDYFDQGDGSDTWGDWIKAVGRLEPDKLYRTNSELSFAEEVTEEMED